MAEGWIQWMEAEKAQIVRVAPWTGDFSIRRELLLRPLPHSAFRTSDGRETYRQILAALDGESSHRSDVTSIFEAARPNFSWRKGTDPAADDTADGFSMDLWKLDAWYSRGRYWAAAAQRESSLAITLSPDETPIGSADRLLMQLGRAPRRVDVELPDEFLTLIGMIDGDAYGEFTYRNRTLLKDIWASGRPTDVRRLVYNAMNAFDTPPSRVTRAADWMSSLAIVAVSSEAVARTTGSHLATLATTSVAAGATAARSAYKGRRRVVARRVIEHLSTRKGGMARAAKSP